MLAKLCHEPTVIIPAINSELSPYRVCTALEDERRHVIEIASFFDGQSAELKLT
jgi:hypothetical protein